MSFGRRDHRDGQPFDRCPAEKAGRRRAGASAGDLRFRGTCSGKAPLEIPFLRRRGDIIVCIDADIGQFKSHSFTALSALSQEQR